MTLPMVLVSFMDNLTIVFFQNTVSHYTKSLTSRDGGSLSTVVESHIICVESASLFLYLIFFYSREMCLISSYHKVFYTTYTLTHIY